MVASLSVVVSPGTTNELEEYLHQFNADSKGNEAQPHNSLNAADKELTEENVNMLISDDSDNELASQLS